MRFITDVIAKYVNSQLENLSKVKDGNTYESERLYKFSNSYKDRVFSSYDPAYDNDANQNYINVALIGSSEERYNTEKYNIAFRIILKDTKNIPWRDFYYQCRGFRNLLRKMGGKKIEEMYISEVIAISGLNPIKTDRNTFYCEILLQYVVDVGTIPDSDIITTFDY